MKRERLLSGEYAFDFVIPPHVHASIHVVSGDIFSLVFAPMLSKSEAQKCVISVTHLKFRTCHLRIFVLGQTRYYPQVVSDLKFLVFETHAVRLSETDQVESIYLGLENLQLTGPDAPAIMVPHIDFRWFFQEHFPGRYTGLPYFPPEQLDVANIDASQISQDNPLWFKLRGTYTGSAIPKALGEWAPRLDSKEAKTFRRNQKEEFTGWKEITVRMGKLREINQLICYLHHYPHKSFSPAGYYSRMDLPPNWGASPDGIVIDGEMNWSLAPKAVAENYQEANPKRGLVEFKASKSDYTFWGKHIEQCLWQLLCVNVIWVDLIRYCESFERDAKGLYQKQIKAKCVRIYRCAKTEEELCRLIRQVAACKSDGEFLKLIWTEPFIAFRSSMDKLAKDCEENATELLIPHETLEEMEKWRKRVSMSEYGADKDPLLKEIEEGQGEVISLYQGDAKERREFVKAANRQIGR